MARLVTFGRSLVLSSFGLATFVGLSIAPAQVSINIGTAPVCPYGYYDYAPYSCSPYGYYGPDWFSGGVFIGAGPWFHGPRGFYGHVDNRYDPNHGYRGPYPERGEQPFQNFRGNEGRDGEGHMGNPGHGPEGERSGGFRGGRGDFHGGAGDSHGGHDGRR